MSMIQRGPVLFGLMLGLTQAAASPAVAQMFAERDSRVALPRDTVVDVPPQGFQFDHEHAPLDPAATARRGPKFIAKKIRSWHWRRLQGRMLGYPEEFPPKPLGESLHSFGRVMVANGVEARMTLYDYDFEPGSSQLSARGRDQLSRVAAQLAASPFPLIVERTDANPALALERREAVLNELASVSFPIDPDRVLVGAPLAFGMSGVNAQIIGANSLNRTQQYGPPTPLNANGVNSPSGVTNQMSGVVPSQ